MNKKKLQCVVDEKTNKIVIRPVITTQEEPPKIFMATKDPVEGKSLGRWTKEEHLAFVQGIHVLVDQYSFAEEWERLGTS